MTGTADRLPRQAGAHTYLVRADNPSPMTLEGTNTWILTGPRQCVVIDPGPDVNGHLADILQACAALATTPSAIVLTHDHSDHSDAAPALSTATGAPVLSARAGTLAEGDFSPAGADGPALQVVALPGHSGDSVGIVFRDDAAIATGDILFDRGSSLVWWPDGSLAEYLATLDRLDDLISRLGLAMMLPGHGGVLTDPLGHIARFRQHRMERLDQVRSAVAAVGPDADAVVQAVYGDIAPGLRNAARHTVQAQLEYLGHHQPHPV